jgi:hypothetical protein
MPVGGPAITKPFVFTVSLLTGCGDVLTLRFDIRDGSEALGTLEMPLQTGELQYAFLEDFDSVAAPALPPGWATSTSENHQLWRTSTNRTQSAPNAIFSPAPIQRGVNELVSPQFLVQTAAAEVRFRNWYELETTFLRNRLFDGSVMEISIAGGQWQDILDAGGSFISGGYDGVLDACCQNPLAGRMAWSGRSGVNQTSEFITTRASLPPTAAGSNVRLRWRIGTDIGTFREGQYIDDLAVTDGYACYCTASTQNSAPFDFDGDGRTDISVYDLNDSADRPDFRVLESSTGQVSAAFFGSGGDIPAIADFDGDGKADIAVFRPSSGTWFILRSLDGTVTLTGFGLAGDLPVPADYDGDGRSDIAVYRPSEGIWYLLRSSDGQFAGVRFGLADDLPVPADFDGDGRADFAVFRPSSGVWYIFRSSDNGYTIVQFGLGGDRPVPGDFDGDGKADLAVYRPSERLWYLLRSQAGFAAVQFGLPDDIPIQADLDGDGRRDIAVFRASDSVWYYLRSSDGAFAAAEFGGTGEMPVPGIYVR